MKKFFSEAPYWKVFIVCYLILTSVALIMFLGAERFVMNEEGQKLFSLEDNLKVSAILGLLFALLCTLSTSQLRGSARFWKAAECFDKQLDQANSRLELMLLIEPFNMLVKKSMGSIHDTELVRLKTTLDTKMKCIQK